MIKNPLIWLVLLTVLSSQMAFAAPVTDLNLTLVNSPASLNKDLNFQLDWTQEDVNAIYWDFSGDGNVTQNAGGSITFDCLASDNTDLNSLYGWFYNTDGSGEAVVLNNQCNFNALNDGTGGTSSLQDDVNVSVSSEGDTVKVQFIWEGSTVNAGTWAPFRFGFAVATSVGLNANAVLVSVTDDVDDDYEIRIDGSASGDTGDLNVGDTYGFILTRTGSAGIYDWNFLVNDVSVHNGTGADLGSDILHMAWGQEASGSGTGDVNSILDDISIFENGVVRPGPTSTTLPSPQFQSHTFSTTGAKTIIVTVQTDVNVTTSLDLNITGFLDITVYDENALTVISGATIDFNSGTYTTDVNGNVNIPLANLTTGEFTITVDVNSDFPSRSFIFDLNQFSVEDLNLLMLENNNGSSRSYQIFQPDQATLITNSLVEWRRAPGIINGISQRIKTNASAELSFFGQQDANYVMRIFDTVSNVTRDYNGTIVKVKIPLNITDVSQTLTPYDVEVGGLAQQSFSSISTDITFQIFSDTTNFYNVNIDFNADFFPTTFLVRTRGGLATLELQPYLVPITANLTTIIFTIDNINQKQTIPGIRIVSETIIGGVLVEVESKVSDITGTAEFHFEIGRDYVLSFFDSDGELIFSGTLSAKSSDTTLFAALAQQTLFASADPSSSFNLSWIPVVSQVNPGDDGNVTISNIINPFNTVIGDVNVFISHLNDSNVIFQTVFTLDSSDQNQFFAYDVNVDGFNNNFPLIVNIQVFDINGFQITTIQIKNYSFKTTFVTNAFVALREEFGAFPIMFISVIISAALIGIITIFSLTTNNNWVGVLAIIVTAFFVVVTWIPIEAWLVSGAMGIGMILWRDREQ